MDVQLGEGFPDAVIREGADGGFGEPSLTQHILSSRGGDRLWWMRTGTVFVRLCTKESKEKHGKRCTLITKSCTRLQGPRSLVTVKRQKPFGQ